MSHTLNDRLIKAEYRVRRERGLARVLPLFQARGSVSGPAAFSEATLAEDWRRQCVAAAIGAGARHERPVLPLRQNPRRRAFALGRSERTATRKARLLESASFADFVRLTPEQNVKLGLSPKARHYVLKDVKRVTKATPTISARQYETKKARELFGLSPEQATEARRHRRNSYVSADQRERVAKAAITREENEGHRRDQEAPRVRRARSEQLARQKTPWELVPDFCRRGAPLSRHKAAQARRGAYPGRRVALVHRLRAPVQGPPL